MDQLLRSVRHAAKGIFYTFKNERNFQVELAAAGVVGLLMLCLSLARWEEVVLVVMIVLVLTLELVNTATERIMDILKPRVHPYARVVKDVMAGSVLLAGIGALVIALIIFSPYFFS